MCIFSGPVQNLAGTSIFARVSGDRQFLVYELTVETGTDNAMVLPLPVRRNGSEDAVQFINLQSYSGFFDDLDSLFQETGAMSFAGTEPVESVSKTLEVRQVGSFEASYVPTPPDFSRLDERFRLPSHLWKGLPGYGDYGFAVFKLKGGARRKIHPMAFDFPTRDPARLFFPTVHVHDGQVHEEAPFDHALYCQAGSGSRLPDSWTTSPEAARMDVQIDLSGGIVDGARRVHRRKVRGSHRNEDIWLDIPTETSSA